MEMYIRFCKVPQDEKSWNFMRNRKEIGVSVFKADTNNMPILENVEQAKSLWARLNRRHYLVTGEVVGYGQDGEPLLKNVKVVRRLRLDRTTLEELITATFERLYKYKLPTKHYYDLVDGYGKTFGMNENRIFIECADPLLMDHCELRFVHDMSGVSYRGIFYTNDFREPTANDFEPSSNKTAFLFERMRNDIAWMSDLSGISKSTLYKFKNDGKASQKTIEKLSRIVDTYFYIDYVNSQYY